MSEEVNAMSEAASVRSWLPDRELREADLALLPDDGHKYEIVDGSLIVSPAPSSIHQVIANELGKLLDLGLPADLYALAGVNVRLGTAVLIPDMAVVRREVALDGVTAFEAADVLLVAEIVSPSSVTIDRLIKPAVYASAGIPSYWRIEQGDHGPPTVVVHELAGSVYRQLAEVSGAGELAVDQPFPLVIRPRALLPQA
jgi:Uma2 family endonuclease